MSTKEIEYFNGELRSQNLEITNTPEYLLIPSEYSGYYSLKFTHNCIDMHSVSLKTVKEWSQALGIDSSKFLICIQS